MIRTEPACQPFPMPRDPDSPLAPPPEYARLREQCPVARTTLWNGQDAWLVSRHADQRAVLGDSRFSNDPTRPGYPLVSGAQAAIATESRSFHYRDDPDHDRYRRMLTPDFLVKRVEQRRPRLQQAVDRVVSDLLAGPRPADLVEAFARPVPAVAACELVGAPYRDHTLFQRVNAVLVARDCTAEQAVAARAELAGYLDGLVARKEDDPGDDMISRLLAEQVRPGRLGRAELTSTVLAVLLAGLETTAGVLSLGVLALLQHPEQLAHLREADPPAVAAAVEELLRYLTVGHYGLRRVATADTVVGGQEIRVGEGVVLLTDSGNHDDEAFPDAGRLDLRRPARRHLAFGHGIHQCVGAALARVELQVALPALVRQVPTLRLAAPMEELRFCHDAGVYGVRELPMVW